MATTYMEGRVIVHDGVVPREDVTVVAVAVESEPVAPPLPPAPEAGPVVTPAKKAKGKKR